jgi:hypothetical protein
VYYIHRDEKFSIKNQKRNEEETDAINTASITLHQFKDFPIGGLPTNLQPLLQRSDIREIACSDHNKYLNGLEYLPTLYQHIINYQALSIEYLSFKHKEAKRTFRKDSRS